MSADQIFKVLVLGDVGVGKTSLITKFTDDVFIENTLSSIGVDFKVKQLTIENKIIRLQIWDTAGGMLDYVNSGYYRGCNGVLILYDVTNKNSFENVRTWMEETKQICPTASFMLVGTKIDLEEQREVEYEFAEALGLQLATPAFEVSSKLAINIDSVFDSLTKAILNRRMGRKEIILLKFRANHLPAMNLQKTSTSAFVHLGLLPNEFKYSNPPSFSSSRFEKSVSSEVKEKKRDPQWENFQPGISYESDSAVMRVELWHKHLVRGKSLIGYADFRLADLEIHGDISVSLLSFKSKQIEGTLQFSYVKN